MNLRSGGDRAKRGHLTCFYKKNSTTYGEVIEYKFRKEAVP